MNILFYLKPKSEVIYIYDDDTVAHALERLEEHRFSSVPILTRRGKYVGSLTEGDLLWTMMEKRWGDDTIDEATHAMLIRQIHRCRDNQPVNVNCRMEDLIQTSMNQNYIPVIDDEGVFIGIVTRKSIISYCYEGYRKMKDQ